MRARSPIRRRASRSFLVLALAALDASAGELRFENLPPTFTAVDYSTAMTVADFDADGRPDVVVGHRDFVVGQGNLVSVLPSDAPCGFRPPIVFEIGEAALISAFVTGDWNGDGHLDFAAAKSTHGVAIVRGDGAGGFAWTQDPDIGPVLTSMTAADLDSDGRLDLVFGCRDASGVAWLRGDGTGFDETVRFVPFAWAVESAATGDFDEDGNVDFLVGSIDRGVAVAFGNGVGGFSAWRLVPDTEPVTDVRPADWDADGHLDVATLDGEVTARVSLGDGDGGFASPSTVATPLGAVQFTDLDEIDADEDGVPDLVLADERGRHVLLLSGLGGGIFDAARPLTGGFYPNSVEVADWDVDGDDDLVVGNVPSIGGVNTHVVTLFLNDGSGGFPSIPTYPAGPSPIRHVVTDFDSDGRLDVATVDFGDANGLGGGVSILLGDGAGGLGAPRAFAAGRGGRHLVLADMNGDAASDLVVSNEVSRDVSVLLGDGAGSFAEPITVPVPGAAGSLAVADFDEDGALDVVVTYRDVVSSWVALRFLRGDGAGGLMPAGDLGGMPSSRNSFIAADWNADGHVDLALEKPTHIGISAIEFFLGDGSLGFARTQSFGGMSTPLRADFTAGDFNADGRLDVVWAGWNGARAFAGDGTGSFDLVAVASSTVGPTTSAQLADLDDDGHLDLLTGGAVLSAIRGDGQGGFESPVAASVIGSGHSPRHAIAADMDGDGHFDLTSANELSNDVTVLLNRSFEPDPCGVRVGNVNAAAGPVTPVVFVNGLKGAGPARRIVIDRFAPFVLRVKGPPSNPLGPSNYALFASIGPPTTGTFTTLPYGPIGFPPLAAKKTWNNTGDVARFGAPDLPSVAAPEVTLRRNGGVRKRLVFFLQGVIEDSASPSGVYAITNGIEVDSR